MAKGAGKSATKRNTSQSRRGNKKAAVVKQAERQRVTQTQNVIIDDDVLHTLAIEDPPEVPKDAKRSLRTKQSEDVTYPGDMNNDLSVSKENSLTDAIPKSKAGLAKNAKVNGKQKQEDHDKESPTPVENRALLWDPDYVKQLATQYPDKYWKRRAAPRGEPCTMMSELERENLPRKYGQSISVGGNIYGLKLSPDGTVLAVFSSRPYISLYMALKPWSHIKDLFDEEDKHINDYYKGVFSPDCRYIAAGGKHKDRTRWNRTEEDNEILPCPVKIFDISTSKVITRLEVHDEEILSIRGLFFNGDYYYLTTSQDGSIRKWKMQSDYKTLVETTKMEDEVTCMAFDTSFLPGTGNKYFLAACDAAIRLFDFETARCLQTFEFPYSEYCENVQFVYCVDLPESPSNFSSSSSSGSSGSPIPQFAYFVTRGVETPDDELGNPVRPNFCTLNKLCYPQAKGGEFICETVRHFEHPSYLSNYWLVRQTTNGRYLLAPQQNGKLACFNLLTGEAVWFITFQDEPLRAVLFHPEYKVAYAGGDGDGTVYICGQGIRDEEALPWTRVDGVDLPQWAQPPAAKPSAI